MRLRSGVTGRIIEIDPIRDLLAPGGGEGRVFAVRAEATLVAKLFHSPGDRLDKIAAMVRNPPSDPTAGINHVSIAWPTDPLFALDHPAGFAGFLMPRIDRSRPIAEVYHPQTRSNSLPGFHYLYLHQTAANLASAIAAVHERGYVVGDVNDLNVLVNNQSLVTLIDTDSMQVRGRQAGQVYRCVVGREEFTPRELVGKDFSSVDRTIEHDLFGLAVLLFQLLMEGTHPFAGVHQGAGDSPSTAQCIAGGLFPFGPRRMPIQVPPHAPPFEILAPPLRELFLRCFIDGHNHPTERPSAELWNRRLKDACSELQLCRSNQQHRFGPHLSRCPWCERRKQVGRDPFPLPGDTGSPKNQSARQPLGTQHPLPPAQPASGYGVAGRGRLARWFGLRGIHWAWLSTAGIAALAALLPLAGGPRGAAASLAVVLGLYAYRSARGAFGLWRLLGLVAAGLGGWTMVVPMMHLPERLYALLPGTERKDRPGFESGSIPAHGTVPTIHGTATEPPNFQRLRDSGLAYLRRKEWVAAAADLSKAFDLDPRNGDVAVGLLQALYRDGQLEAVQRYGERALTSVATDKQRAQVLSYLADVNVLSGEFASAEERYRRAMVLAPGHGDALLRLQILRIVRNPSIRLLAAVRKVVTGTLLEDEDLMGLDANELRVVRGGPFARHGYRLNESALEAFYYGSLSPQWLRLSASASAQRAELDPDDQGNVVTIKETERLVGSKRPATVSQPE